MSSASANCVAVSVSASQLLKLIKSVSSLVFIKNHCNGVRFPRKAPNKKPGKTSKLPKYSSKYNGIKLKLLGKPSACKEIEDPKYAEI